MKQQKSKRQKDIVPQLWLIISNWLDKLSHTTEDEDLLQKLCLHYSKKRTIIGGKIESVAAALLWLYSRVNFLGEHEGKMWRQKDLAELCGTSTATIGSKASAIMKAMKIDLLDIRYSRKELARNNPMNQIRVDPETGLIYLADEDDIFGVPIVHNEHDYYYDAMESLSVGDADGAIRLLNKALEIDNHSVEAYVGITEAYRYKENNKKVRENTELAFTETKRIFTEWPDRIIWGEIKNHQYLRAIKNMAFAHWIAQEQTLAEELFKLLLHLNPNDNQGVRFSLACFYAGLSPESVDDLIEEGNQKQDWNAIDTLLEEQNKIHDFWFRSDES
ncbi:MAG: DUF6398 domain-containing protein [Candidatus Uhrbacteria bacterium]